MRAAAAAWAAGPGTWDTRRGQEAAEMTILDNVN